ncbi:MAG: hypothetical protein EBR81_12240 [Proteobacteria bacterium]|nr:hypothetical protein [Pseudomonadota bacterium]
MEKPIDKGAAQFAADEIQRLEYRIKRLEEAGDAMHRYITFTRGLLPECTNYWNKAKEAKP